MKSLARMEEEARRTGTCQRGGNLATNQTRLTHACNNDLTLTRQHAIYRTDKLITQRRSHLLQCLGLKAQCA